MVNIYLAGCFNDREVMRERAAVLEGRGWDITHRWFDVSDEDVEKHGHDIPYLKKHGELDADGVMQADVVVACMEHCTYPYRGTWTEVGIAIGKGVPVVLFCPSVVDGVHNMNTYNVFYHHHNVTRVESFDEVVDAIDKE